MLSLTLTGNIFGKAFQRTQSYLYEWNEEENYFEFFKKFEDFPIDTISPDGFPSIINRELTKYIDLNKMKVIDLQTKKKLATIDETMF